MDYSESFLKQELARIDKNIARLENHLNQYRPDDPRGDGQRALLDVQRQTHALVTDLAAHLDDANDLLFTLRLRYLKATRQHTRVLELNGDPRKLLRSDPWWDTLGEMQYLQDLQHRYVAWRRRHPSMSPSGNPPSRNGLK